MGKSATDAVSFPIPLFLLSVSFHRRSIYIHSYRAITDTVYLRRSTVLLKHKTVDREHGCKMWQPGYLKAIIIQLFTDN